MSVPLPVQSLADPVEAWEVEADLRELAQRIPGWLGHVTFGVAALGPGGVDGFTSQTLAVNHGLTAANGAGLVPRVVLVTAQFGAWTSVNAGNYTATTFSLSGRTIAGAAAANWPASVNVAWLAIG